MKCPACGKKVKAAQTMTCSCGYKFVINPKEYVFTDAFLLAVVKAASKNNNFFVTPNQIYSSFISILYKKNRISYVPFIFSVVIIFILSSFYYLKASKPAIILGGVIFIAACVYLIIKIAIRKPIPSKKLVISWAESISSKKSGDHIISRPRLKKAPPEWKEPDIYDYGFERILVVQRDIVVDLFVKNNFHSEERTLIISSSGYPSYLVKHVAKTMNDNPDMPVFYLHDSSVNEEKNIKSFLEKLKITAQNRRVIDLGLSQQIVTKLKSLNKIYSPHSIVPVDAIPFWVLKSVILQAFGRDTEELIDRARASSTDVGAGKTWTDSDAGFIYVASDLWGDSSIGDGADFDADISFG
ncbi:MAG TPA: hypothetical protein PLR52_09055 [Bacteroidales bacterium]|nr:hypothetical protein [Bacteroidales bacterium]